jgi:hypothetical protein
MQARLPAQNHVASEAYLYGRPSTGASTTHAANTGFLSNRTTTAGAPVALVLGDRHGHRPTHKRMRELMSNTETLNDADSRPIARPLSVDGPSRRMESGSDRTGVSGSAASTDESLIVDERVGLSPAEQVEGKLTRILKETSLPVSHLQARGLLRSR